MKGNYFFIIKICVCLIILIQNISYGQTYTISGTISDEESGEALIAVVIHDKISKTTTQTNEYGFYSLTTPTDSVSLIIQYIGYTTRSYQYKLSSDKNIPITLKPEVHELTQVEIKGTKSTIKEEINSTQMSTLTLDPKQVKSLPGIAGEKDIIKAFQMMPGIQRGNEGGAAMFVRGGTHDQNLIILDEATVYNISHLIGFFSIFNNDALKEASMIKGGFPAQYGGRLSSILDIKMNEGNNQAFTTEGSVGLLSSQLTLQGPIKKDKVSFMLSGRRTYLEKVLSLTGISIPYYFYDINAKVNFKLSDKDKIYLSSYYGNDVLKVNNSGSELVGSGFILGNFTHTIRWNHIYNPKLFSNFSFIHTQFRYNIEATALSNSFYVRSFIRDFGVKGDWEYFFNANNHIQYGASITTHTFKPNLVNASGDVSEFVKPQDNLSLKMQDIGIYVSNNQTINKRLSINYGLRFSGALLPSKMYGGLEPRFSAKYSVNEKSSVKWSYTRMKQYMHLVSSSAINLPTDLWYPVTKSIKPQISDQIALGYFYGIEKLNTTLSVEGYYKWMDNLIEYREGARLILNNNFDEELLAGKGKAYGLEFLVKKNAGRFNGWAAYTLSWATRKFDGLNDGKQFYSKFDRRHNFSLVGIYDISKRITVSATWVYHTGTRFTPVVGSFLMPNSSLTDINILPIYTERNSVVLAPTHRLDANVIIRSKKDKAFKGEWHIGAYNLYNRTSPYRTTIVQKEDGSYKYVQTGLFGFIPSIAYNFKF